MFYGLAALQRQLIFPKADGYTCYTRLRARLFSEMSVTFSGTRSRSAGVISAIAKELKSITLKPVKKVQVQFDPFHEQVTETRNFLHFFCIPRVTATNPSCAIKTNIVCDRSEPKITFHLASGDNVVFKSANLSALNILELYNKHITAIAKSQEPQEPVVKEKRKRHIVKIKPGRKRRGVYLMC